MKAVMYRSLLNLFEGFTTMLLRAQAPRILTAAILVGSLAAVSPVYAADASAPAATPAAATTSAKHKHHEKQEDMAQKVEDRIKTLHAKLNITSTEEAAWSDVAQAMRDNEASIGTLIHERHKNAETMTAVQDLEAYQKIAQAHADGLQKVADAFSKLYDGMPDEQKANADVVFGHFVGHRNGDAAGKKPEGM
jgi:periplasmic protein CpxP/Spy